MTREIAVTSAQLQRVLARRVEMEHAKARFEDVVATIVEAELIGKVTLRTIDADRSVLVVDVPNETPDA